MRIDTPSEQYDIVVVGGGLVGASFACAVAREGLSVLVVEAVAPANEPAQPSFDARSTALSFGSRQIFDGMGLWQELAPAVTPIQHILVSDKGHLGSVELDHEELGQEALGYVAENRDLGRVLNRALDDSSSLQLLSPALIVKIEPKPEGMGLRISANDDEYSTQANLVVLAEGGRSPICQQLGIQQTVKDYDQHALIANIGFERPHDNIAFERFTADGPLAVLPLEPSEGSNRGALVWTLPSARAGEFMNAADDELLALLQAGFGDRLGTIQTIGKRFSYPLSLTRAREQVRPGLALLGNVAHTLHPVAGQGLNLALRDMTVLVEVIHGALDRGESPGDMNNLQQFLEACDSDQSRTIGLTDMLITLFSNREYGKVMARKMGMLSIEMIPALRKQFARQAMGI